MCRHAAGDIGDEQARYWRSPRTGQQPRQDGRVVVDDRAGDQPCAAFQLQRSCQPPGPGGLELAKLSVEGEMSAGQLRVQEADARLLDGRITTSLELESPGTARS